MGCAASSPEADRPSRRAESRNGGPSFAEISLPDVKWDVDQKWTEQLAGLEFQAIELNGHDDFLKRYPDILFQLARERLEREYPECAREGTIAGLSAESFCVDGNPCAYPCQKTVCLDDSRGGIVYASTMVIAKPLLVRPAADASHQTPKNAVPGVELDGPEMRSAKDMTLRELCAMRAQGINVRHAVVNIAVGADMVLCQLDTSATSPTILHRPPEPSDSFKKDNRMIARKARSESQLCRGMFLSQLVKSVITQGRRQCSEYTVWDQGKLPFYVKGKLYPEPTRLLVTRKLSLLEARDMEADVFEAHSAIDDILDDDVDKIELFRATNPGQEFGDIIDVTLVVATSMDVTWPDTGAYRKSQAFKAAEQAVQQHVKGLYSQGKVQRCTIYVTMGVDRSMFKFVGNPTSPAQAVREASDQQPIVSEANSPSAQNDSLKKDFGITLTPQAKQGLFASQGHFEACKETLRKKAETTSPEYLRAREVFVAPMAARHFLEINFPNCVVSDEGPFPAVLPDGTEVLLEETRLLVARDPEQEPRSIVAAINVVPRPGGPDSEPGLFSSKSWLDTPEMQQADNMLLSLLRKWHKQGLVSDVDCFAQVMMVKDATVYRFVEGERFEDYSEERIAQIKWC
ncbi:transcriptional activator xlnR [Purpureocillium lavendulum]|uniref:Transcriptional activator xlnR n=1 Tax=Purpureocillium lavendulum TaxID=1247861 RepID=A0AB34FPV9_9HYPO|nr:transcriptional activator xlnR [Purpureocillium lavendulum]